MNYHIEIDVPLTGASFNNTSTINEGFYRRYANGRREVALGHDSLVHDQATFSGMDRCS